MSISTWLAVSENLEQKDINFQNNKTVPFYQSTYYPTYIIPFCLNSHIKHCALLQFVN